MAFPRGDEYVAAIQNPHIVFSDSELKSSKVELNNWQLPKPYSGGFTTTFRLMNHSKEWAVRCFTKAVPDLQTRYDAISNFLKTNPAPFFVSAEYIFKGIKIGSAWHPIIKMQWLNGEPLNIFLSNNLRGINTLNNAITEFTSLVKKLEEIKVAHGDLQHGNILVKQGKMYLIDYDGMYLDSLSYLTTNEIGHINYQHPNRTAKFNDNKIDRFSAIVIYLGMKALTVNPSLWNKYDNDENILFKADDFIKLQSSSLIKELIQHKELIQLVERFLAVCKFDLKDIPKLEDFINGKFEFQKINLAVPPKQVEIPVYRSQYDIVDGNDKQKLLINVGKKIEVIAFINDHYIGTDVNGNDYTFLNVGRYPYEKFKLVFWNKTIRKFENSGISVLNYYNRWIKITGIITEYRNTPNIIVETTSQIQILPDEKTAKAWLGIFTKPEIERQQTTTKSSSSVLINDKISGRSTSTFTNTSTTRSTQQKPNITINTNLNKQSSSSSTSYSKSSQTTNTPYRSSSSTSNSGCIVLIFMLTGILSSFIYLASTFFITLSSTLIGIFK